MSSGGEPKTAIEWTDTSRRFISEADRVLKTGERLIAYERYGYAAEAAAKAMILRRGILPEWPTPGQPHADEVRTHSVLKLIKFGGVFQTFCSARAANGRLADSLLVAKEWFPMRYSMNALEHSQVVRLGRAVKYLIEWLDAQ
jgi:hypothetical protein